jgi:trimeric autotransporter adhesin
VISLVIKMSMPVFVPGATSSALSGDSLTVTGQSFLYGNVFVGGALEAAGPISMFTNTFLNSAGDTITLPGSSGTLALATGTSGLTNVVSANSLMSSSLNSGTGVITLTVTESPAFTGTLSAAGITSLGALSSGTNSATVGSLTASGSNIQFTGTNQVTTSVGTMTFPSSAGTLALENSGSAYVSEAQLDGNALPASLTNLTVSGTSSLTGTVSAGTISNLVSTISTNTSDISSNTTAIGVLNSSGTTSGSVSNSIQAALSNTNQSLTIGAITATSIYSSGTISCGTNSMTCGALSSTSVTSSGSMSAGTNSLTCGNLTASGSSIQFTGTNQLTTSVGIMTFPSSAGTLALENSGSGYVTEATLDGGTLPASLTTLSVSGTSSLTGTVSVGTISNLGSTVVGNTNAIGTLNSSSTVSGSVSNSIQSALSSTNQAIGVGSINATSIYSTGTMSCGTNSLTCGNLVASGNLAASGNVITAGPIFCGIITSGGQYLELDSDQSSFACSIQSVHDGVNYTPLYLNPSGGLIETGAAFTVEGDLTIVSNTLINSAGGTMTLPTGGSSLGALALASSIPIGTLVTTTTLDNDTLPASLTTLTTSSTATIGSTLTVGGGSGTTLTSQGNFAVNLPDATGTLALAPGGGGTLVTTTTLDNNTLPASLTTLTLSGNITLSNNTLVNADGGSMTLPNSTGSLGNLALVSNIPNVPIPASCLITYDGSSTYTLITSTGGNVGNQEGFSLSSNVITILGNDLTNSAVYYLLTVGGQGTLNAVGAAFVLFSGNGTGSLGTGVNFIGSPYSGTGGNSNNCFAFAGRPTTTINQMSVSNIMLCSVDQNNGGTITITYIGWTDNPTLTITITQVAGP